MALAHERAEARAMTEHDLLPNEKVKDAFKELKKVVDGVGEPKSMYGVEFLTGTNGFFAPENGAAVSVGGAR